MPLGEPQPFYRDWRFLVWFIPLLVIEIIIGSKLLGRASLLFNLAILLATPLLIAAIRVIRSRGSGELPNAPARTPRVLGRRAVSLLTFVGLLPIAVAIVLSLADAKHGRDFLLDVFAVDVILGGLIGCVAMICSFMVATALEAISNVSW